MTDFGFVASMMPKTIPWKHHGRDLDGMDCVGMIFWFYRMAENPIDHLDLPYVESDAKAWEFTRIAMDRMENEFIDVTEAVRCGLYQDGDIVFLMKREVPGLHFGIVIGDLVYEMTTRLKKTAMQFCRVEISKAFRLEK